MPSVIDLQPTTKPIPRDQASQQAASNSNTLLVVIVAGALLLVVAAFVVARFQSPPTYQADTTPAGVAFNYLLALQQDDFKRAYSYLSPTLKGYPASAEAFATDVDKYPWRFSARTATTHVIEGTNITDTRARVTVRETTFANRGIFESSTASHTFGMTLHLEDDGSWKITLADEYWVSCWDTPDDCYEQRYR
jgi:type II secretory pathway pseudopilin PulG